MAISTVLVMFLARILNFIGNVNTIILFKQPWQYKQLPLLDFSIIGRTSFLPSSSWQYLFTPKPKFYLMILSSLDPTNIIIGDSLLSE